MWHYDMMFHFFCAMGFPVGLDAVARQMGTEHKTEGMHGDMAPKMWQEGKYKEVLAYLEQDVITTLAVYEATMARKMAEWKTKSGAVRAFILPEEGWLDVSQALKLPKPDQSWMSKPWPREKFTAWIGTDLDK
jgi:hypothetical protein